ncbi:MAG: helix-turn-helix transcriptional regulator [Gemmatimonadaceae bacterium]|nr:helix-turn-helix transcriptional regulator [Gemmatimonadaceae bacterium]
MATPCPPVTVRPAVASLHPWLVALDAFRVPFLCYEREGELIHVSGAVDQFGESTRTALTAQGSRLVSSLDDARADASSGGPWTPVHAAPATVAPVMLTVFLCRDLLRRHPIAVVLAPTPTAAEPDIIPTLSVRQNQVARLLAAGACVKQVARSLDISVHTARHHVEHVYRRLGVRSRAEVARLLR